MAKYLVCAFIFAIAITRYSMAIDMNDFFPNINNNFTKVTWAHAVNNQALLNETLNGDLMMIEADIVLGTLTNNEYIDKIPIMGHPPATTSDLSLTMFLKWVMDYNEAAIKHDKGNAGKGIKLDFKSIEVFEASIPILLEVYEKMHFPVWINADILRGPLTFATPVDPERFFNGSKSFSNSILSVGWTTTYGGIIKNLSYTSDNMSEMLAAIGTYNDIGTPVTFPVRAGMIARSKTELEHLMANMPMNTTITIWSGADDGVDVSLLRKVIFSTGLDKVFIDVPENLLSQLDLENPDKGESTLLFVKGGATNIFTSAVSVVACLIEGAQRYGDIGDFGHGPDVCYKTSCFTWMYGFNSFEPLGTYLPHIIYVTGTTTPINKKKSICTNLRQRHCYLKPEKLIL